MTVYLPEYCDSCPYIDIVSDTVFADDKPVVIQIQCRNHAICERMANYMNQGATTDEPEPTRRGRWNWVDGVRCSLCNYKLQITGVPNYCPNCGAKMDAPTQKSVGKALKALEVTE